MVFIIYICVCVCVYYYEYSRVFLKEKHSTEYDVVMARTNKKKTYSSANGIALDESKQFNMN